MLARVVSPLLLTVAAVSLAACAPAPAPPTPAPTPAVDEPPHGHTNDDADGLADLSGTRHGNPSDPPPPIHPMELVGLERDPPPPGPRALESDAALTEFLAGKTFVVIPGRADRWTFHADGTYVAELARVVTTGRWTVTATELHLTDRTESRGHTMPARAPDLVMPFRSLDGKLNVEIDGRQFRVE